MRRFTSLFGATALAACGLAQASPVSSFQSVDVTGFPLGYVKVDTSLTNWVAAGEVLGTRTVNGSSYSLLTYCTEITQDSLLNTTYTDYQPVANGTTWGFTAVQADRLGKLYTLAGTTVDTLDKSAAFQLSVWEIVQEAPKNSLDLLSGVFSIDAIASQTPLTLAGSWLNTISQPGALNQYTATRLHSPTAQDYVLFNKVPEPGALSLAALALGALAWSRRGRPAAGRAR